MSLILNHRVKKIILKVSTIIELQNLLQMILTIKSYNLGIRKEK